MLGKNRKPGRSRIKNPSGKKAIRRGILAVLLTDSLLLGVRVARNDRDYDLKKSRLR